jgi:hypothetical protein
MTSDGHERLQRTTLRTPAEPERWTHRAIAGHNMGSQSAGITQTSQVTGRWAGCVSGRWKQVADAPGCEPGAIDARGRQAQGPLRVMGGRKLRSHSHGQSRATGRPKHGARASFCEEPRAGADSTESLQRVERLSTRRSVLGLIRHGRCRSSSLTLADCDGRVRREWERTQTPFRMAGRCGCFGEHNQSRRRRCGPRHRRSACGTDGARDRAPTESWRGRRAALRAGRNARSSGAGGKARARRCRFTRGDAIFG